MQINGKQKRQHRFTDSKACGNRRGSSPPFQEREEDFADWVRKPLSALKVEVDQARAPRVTKRELHKAEPRSYHSSQSNDQGDP